MMYDDFGRVTLLESYSRSLPFTSTTDPVTNINTSYDMPDKEGDLTSVIIHYDFESDEFHYLYHEYSGGYGQTKVVPVY